MSKFWVTGHGGFPSIVRSGIGNLWLILVAAGLSCFTSPAIAAGLDEAPIVLHTHDEEISEEALPENPAVGTIRCIMDKMGLRAEIQQAPRLRNEGLLSAGQIDGVFPNLPDEELDRLAIASEPFALERWSYVQRRDSKNPARPRDHIVGAVLGSNESRYLRNQGFRMFDSIPNMASLIKLLAARRIPYAMTDDWSFETEAENLGYGSDMFRSAIVRYVPLQAYFSKPFIDANPDFLARFNEGIENCVHGGRHVALWEREVLKAEADRILAGALEDISALVSTHLVIDGLDPALPQVDAFSGVDAAWTDAVSQDSLNPVMESILANPLSDRLRRLAANHSQVTEVFVVNTEGYILGLNRLTSDFWQGDESAAKAVLQGSEDRYFSNFVYDLSTRRFQVQVSRPLYASGAIVAAPIGMITVGIDAAAVLSGQMH